MELTRAGPICTRYLETAFSLAESWDMTQVSIIVVMPILFRIKEVAILKRSLFFKSIFSLKGVQLSNLLLSNFEKYIYFSIIPSSWIFDL